MDINIKEIFQFARQAHGNQIYGDGNEPYICHLSRVALGVRGPILQAIALLHDVVEDTSVSIEEVRDRYGLFVSLPVHLLTHQTNTSYEDYIKLVATNTDAIKVKISDLEDNIYHCEFVYPSYAHLLPRYKKALSVLQNC